MSTGRTRGGARRLAGALGVGLGAAGAAAWALQHRSVSRALGSGGAAEERELSLPEGVYHRFVEMDDGASIHVAERGSGPAIVLLHGLMLDCSIWAHQFRDLSVTHRLLAVDQRGHGRSELGEASFAGGEAGDGAPAMRRLACDLERILAELDVTGALVVGHSMGGMVALQLVRDHPAAAGRRLSGLVLASTMAGPFSDLPGFPSVARLAAPVSARALLLAERAGVVTLPSRDLRYWVSRLGFGADATPQQVLLVEALHRSTSSRTLAALLPSLAVFDLSAGLGSIDLPALVVVGSYDRLIPVRQARRMADAIPDARLVELARCGHMPMIERPHEFSHLLDEFAEKTAPN